MPQQRHGVHSSVMAVQPMADGRCPWDLEPQPAIAPERYFELHAQGRLLVRDWFVRGHRHLDCRPEDSFEPFIFCWISLNGWAACCTGLDIDREWRDALAGSGELSARFEALKAADGEFARSVAAFRSQLPIFKAQQLWHRRLWPPAVDRRGVVAFFLDQHPPISRAPGCFEDHVADGGAVPDDFSHVVMSLYQVRCNLFHGEKNAASEMDRHIVYSAFQVLARFEAACIFDGI